MLFCFDLWHNYGDKTGITFAFKYCLNVTFHFHWEIFLPSIYNKISEFKEAVLI